MPYSRWISELRWTSSLLQGVWNHMYLYFVEGIPDCILNGLRLCMMYPRDLFKLWFQLFGLGLHNLYLLLDFGSELLLRGWTGSSWETCECVKLLSFFFTHCPISSSTGRAVPSIGSGAISCHAWPGTGSPCLARDRFATLARDRFAALARDRFATLARDRFATLARDRLPTPGPGQVRHAGPGQVRHAGPGQVRRVWSARAKSLEILRHGRELNRGHGKDRQWDTFILPLS